MTLGIVLHKQEWKHDPPDWHRMARLVRDMGQPLQEGPWNDEPDKIQWINGESDLDCLMVRNHNGAWCGYVGVPPGHPLYEKSAFDSPADRLSVHGGLTFASKCDEDAPEGHGICHVPLPGREPDVWWLGFDCGHAWDLQPAMPGLLGLGTTYRDVSYVMEQVTILALQLAAIRDNPALLEDA